MSTQRTQAPDGVDTAQNQAPILDPLENVHLDHILFGAMMALATAIAVVVSFLGVYASFFIDSAPAPTIVLLMTVVFIAAFGWVSWRARRVEIRIGRTIGTA